MFKATKDTKIRATRSGWHRLPISGASIMDTNVKFTVPTGVKEYKILHSSAYKTIINEDQKIEKFDMVIPFGVGRFILTTKITSSNLATERKYSIVECTIDLYGKKD